ncbi:MAG: T9SS type A sorting domain-containing protein [Saprospiraceae bacterium]|nr:T9SS type A sorting domain-containing protein [Saprospiraceae bacterium]
MKNSVHSTSIFIALLICLFSITSSAQKEAWNWHFGSYNTLRFTENSVTVEANNNLRSRKSPFSMSDSEGNLLFYGRLGNEIYGNNVHAGAIYNRFHTPMPNGSMHAYETSLQSATAFPKPGSAHQYYVVNLSAEAPNAGRTFRYSVIDMDLDNGRGDVSQKDIFIANYLLDGLSVTKSVGQESFWISTIRYLYPISDIDYVVDLQIYRADSNGIQLWSAYEDTSSLGYNHLKFSPSGRFLHHRNKVYDFDPVLGEVTGYRNIGNYEFTSIFNDKSEFSADSKVLYTFGPSTTGYCIAQYDLTKANPLEDVHIIEGNGSTTGCNGLIKGGMQLGPDGRIYINVNFSSFLNRIEHPEIIGPGCSYNANQLELNNYEFFYDFPIFPTNYLAASTTTNVSDLADAEEWQLFPNPVQDVFTLSSNSNSPGNFQMTIFDSSGRILAYQSINAPAFRVDMQAYPEGFYFVQVLSEGRKQMYKVVRL